MIHVEKENEGEILRNIYLLKLIVSERKEKKRVWPFNLILIERKRQQKSKRKAKKAPPVQPAKQTH